MYEALTDIAQDNEQSHPIQVEHAGSSKLQGTPMLDSKDN